MTDWRQIKKIIAANKTFLVTTHVFPDGDAAGSQLALGEILRALGKKVVLINHDTLPEMYRFLDPRGSVKVWRESLRPQLKKCDAAFVVDVSTKERVGIDWWNEIKSLGIPTMCIDHHSSHEHFCDTTVVEGDVASTGEIIHHLAKSLKVPLTKRIAECLFVAAATDTGWFRFSNTSPNSFRVAEEMCALGVRPDQLYEAIYETQTWSRMRLMERVLATLTSECGGKIAYMHATKEMFDEAGATQEDTENFIDIPRSIKSVQTIFFFREVGDKVKVSCRSKKTGPRVNELAKKFGGGGHGRAAGIVMDQPIESAMRKVIAEAKKLF